MVAKLRAKPDGDRIPVAIGNFAEMAIEGRFSLIFVVYNTFFGRLSQDDQVRCFAGVTRLPELNTCYDALFEEDMT